MSATLRSGSAEAYEQLVRDNQTRMLTLARGVLRDEEEARDAVQEALLSVLRGIDRFRDEAQITTWLHRIVINESLMRLRRRAAKRELRVESSDEDTRRSAESWALDAEQGLLEDERRLLVRSAIGRLSSNHRLVLMLRDVEELTTKETAKFLGVTDNAVKIRLHRARQALAKELGAHVGPGTDVEM